MSTVRYDPRTEEIFLDEEVEGRCSPVLWTELQPMNVARLALALHRDGFDDCAYLFGRECDCSWQTRLEEAIERYNSTTLRPNRDES